MTLYEINDAMQELVDPETGEVLDFGRMDDLTMAWNEKVENVSLWYKNEVAEAEAIKAEAQALLDRAKHHQRKAESLKSYLEYALGESGFETPRVKISRRKSTSVEVDEDFLNWASENDSALLRLTVAPDKKEIGRRLKAGEPVEHAALITSLGMVIK